MTPHKGKGKMGTNTERPHHSRYGPGNNGSDGRSRFGTSAWHEGEEVVTTGHGGAHTDTLVRSAKMEDTNVAPNDQRLFKFIRKIGTTWPSAF